MTLTRPDGTVLRWESLGPVGAPVTLLGHGTGSTPEFVLRALGPSVVAAGGRAVAWWLRGHGGALPPAPAPAAAAAPPAPPSSAFRQHSEAGPRVGDETRGGQDRGQGLGPAGRRLELVDQLADLQALVRHFDARAVGGVSLGAHLAAFAVAAEPARFDTLLAVMPAWSGAAGPVAGLNAGQAVGIEANGIAGEIERIVGDHPGWVASELGRSWPHHDPAGFAAVLRAVASMPGPDRLMLSRITARTTVVTLLGDPMHPADVGRSWADAIPGARLVEVASDAVAADRTALAGA